MLAIRKNSNVAKRSSLSDGAIGFQEKIHNGFRPSVLEIIESLRRLKSRDPKSRLCIYQNMREATHALDWDLIP